MPEDAESKQQGGFLTQADIDAALQGAGPPGNGHDAPLFLDESDIVDDGVEAAPDSEESDYFGLLSKEDVEVLLHGDLGEASTQKVQDEVDSLLQSARSDTGRSGPPAAKGHSTQDDVERLFQDAAAGSDPRKGASPAEAPATDASQEDIDQLLKRAVDAVGEEPEGDAPESPEPVEVVSQADIDRLLKGAGEAGEEVEMDAPDGAPEAEEVVSQADIDRLLKGAGDAEGVPEASSDEDPGASGSLISQDDLDQLLKGPDPETVVEAEASKAPGEHISQEDINRLLKESLDEAEVAGSDGEEADTPDGNDLDEPVILAPDEAPSSASAEAAAETPAEPTRKPVLAGKRRIRIVAGVAAGIVFFMVASLLLMHSRPAETRRKSQVLTFPVPLPGVASASAPAEPSIHLSGFVVLAPDNQSGVVYLTADVVLHFRDAAVVSTIKENEAYVRNIIYETLNNALRNQDIATVNEISLELAIRKALSRIVSRGMIERIDFDKFSLV